MVICQVIRIVTKILHNANRCKSILGYTEKVVAEQFYNSWHQLFKQSLLRKHIYRSYLSIKYI